MQSKEAMGKPTSRYNLLSLLFFCSLTALSPTKSIADDTIKAGGSLNQGEQLVSASQKFVLGFFTSPQGSNFQYLGIWYNNISKTIVWVANRDDPVVNSSFASLKLSMEGNMILYNQTGGALWASNSTRTLKEPVAQLLDSGNLVLRTSGSENPVWQSFDYPTDTLLPGMKLGWDLKSGLNRKLTSWRNSNDPSSGEFTLSINLDGLPQLLVLKGNKTKFRGGPWFGHGFVNGHPSKGTDIYLPNFVYKIGHEISYSYNDTNTNLSRVVVDSAGSVQHLFWKENEQDWHNSYSFEGSGCNDYELCGNFGLCSSTLTANCDCLIGFERKSTQNVSDGCVRKSPEICRPGEGFRKISGLKWPDSTGDLVEIKMRVEDCRAECLKNCSCWAYGVLEVPDVGGGCIIWSQKLMDVRYVPEDGEDLYVRVAASELELTDTREPIVAVIVPTTSVTIILLILLISWYVIRNKNARRAEDDEVALNDAAWTQGNELEMPLFDIATVKAATDNFSASNKIGEGGFGPVFKGKLPSGEEIAVKKMAEGSHQGLQEFKNEVLLISQLQHRNLVKLLGFCIHMDETFLIYEYMPNKSLDYFLFDDKRRSSLNWQKRVDIIIGIARGILYLHRDSRLRIVHRDLKAANILLDSEMKPKISDFGMARMFGGDQMETKTKRVVGTYGYMSPEYAIDGYFSFKSDVFSFGVMLLEIVSGKKNKGFLHPHHQLNLLGHAWNLWNEGKTLELVDEMLESRFQQSEALRYIHIGLLCVQRRQEERPVMSSVLSMLESDSMQLSAPRQPGFYEERFISDIDSSLGDHLISTSNNISMTLLDGR